MSDLEIVLSYARNHCVNKVMELRWEGAGDCEHPAAIIEGLKNETYDSSATRIKFNVTCNLYEKKESDIFDRAYQRLSAALADTTDDQTCSMCAEVDCSRDSHSLDQDPAHIMFVRNIMLTTGGGTDSRTNDGTALQNLHVATVRNRSNSLTDIGQLRLGMSGAPGLISASQPRRMNAPVKKLFVGGRELIEVAKGLGMKAPALNWTGSRDFDDSVNVMKNDGTPLGYKPTYYLTFMK